MKAYERHRTNNSQLLTSIVEAIIWMGSILGLSALVTYQLLEILFGR